MIITGSAILKIFQLIFILINHDQLILIIVEAIKKITTMVSEGADNKKLVDEAKMLAVSQGFTNEYRYFILVCGLFPPDRNIVKNWTKNEQIFLDLISLDGKIGIRHLL